MVYPVTQLVSDAFYISSVVGHDFQVLSGPELSYGVLVLNQIIGDLRIKSDMIPTTKTDYTFTATSGQEMYFIPNMTVLSTLTFTIGPVRYAMVEVPRTSYFGQNRVNNIESLPLSYHTERTIGGLNVFLYFLPNTSYNMQATGLFAPSSVTTGTDLSTVFDQYFINYLTYATACRLCIQYDVNIPAQVQRQLDQYEADIRKVSTPPDLTMQVISAFSNSNAINYAQVGIGQGFTVSSGW